MNLQDQAAFWLTPATSDQFGVRVQDGKRSTGLNTQAAIWRTPAAQEAGAALDSLEGADGERNYYKHNGKLAQYGLSQQVRRWPTPNTRDANSAARQTTTTGVMHDGESATDAIRSFPYSRLHEMITQDGQGSSLAGLSLLPPSALRLNPLFVEWLMGWPIGWTDSGCAGTE